MAPTRPSGEIGNLYDFEVDVLGVEEGDALDDVCGLFDEGVDNREALEDCKTESRCCNPVDDILGAGVVDRGAGAVSAGLGDIKLGLDLPFDRVVSDL